MKDKESMTVAEPVAATFQIDEFGRVSLTTEMKEDVAKAVSDLENGKCFSEADFKERFAKWL
jgi:hypothetical protein